MLGETHVERGAGMKRYPLLPIATYFWGAKGSTIKLKFTGFFTVIYLMLPMLPLNINSSINIYNDEYRQIGAYGRAHVPAYPRIGNGCFSGSGVAPPISFVTCEAKALPLIGAATPNFPILGCSHG